VIEKPDITISTELHDALLRNQGTMGSTYRLLVEGIDKPNEIVERGSASNVGVVSNDKSMIRTIVEGVIPKSPTRAWRNGRAIGGLLRENPEFSAPTKEYLNNLRDELDEYASNENHQKIENIEIEKVSDELEKEIEIQSGVYVYTFPTYIKNPVKKDPERFWLKIGRTEQVVEMRIANQTRQTAMPEDPWILRVYRSDTISNSELEAKLHKMLISAGHNRTEARHGGREWFATNLDFLDEIAALLGLTIQKNDI
jgi:hypothetical protein